MRIDIKERRKTTRLKLMLDTILFIISAFLLFQMRKELLVYKKEKSNTVEKINLPKNTERKMFLYSFIAFILLPTIAYMN
ncbi:MAG: hypothetical protein CL760_11980 [Chloroflexi bacterium]|nr:hypothetical protein [Chloroflexota bacterium]|tara:strand:- start:37086 stop:37325 length:240 start_codon:yes stop_codon:yes gene_type:complete